MSNLIRVLRPVDPRTWHVLIEEPPLPDFDEAYGYPIEIKYRPAPGTPVATIVQVPGTSIYIAVDPQDKQLGTSLDLMELARNIADGQYDNDFRFEIVKNPEPDQPSDMYFVKQIATPSQKTLEHFSTDDPYAAIESARYCQAVPLEERWAADAEREALERAGYR